MSVHRIRFEGPATLAVRVATELADAEGVDLISSEPPSIIDGDRVMLDVTVEAADAAVADAVAAIRDEMPAGASIDIVDD